MLNSERQLLIERFDRSITRHETSSARMKISKWKRLIRHPVFTFKKFISGRIVYPLFNRLNVKLKAKTFFDEDMVVPFQTFSLVWIYGVFAMSDSENRLTKFFIKHVEDNAVFYDLGANCGYYSLLIHKVAENSEVFAFEPDPHILKVLKKNKRKRIHIVKRVVTDNDGVIDFYSTAKHQGALSTIEPDIFPEGKVLDYKKIRLKAITLDSFCRENNVFPNYIKIDVEGAEDKVLLGATNLLREHSPLIAMEIWIRPFTENHKNALNIMKDSGYKVYAINGNGELERVEYENMPELFGKIVEENRNRDEGIYPLAENFIFRK